MFGFRSRFEKRPVYGFVTRFLSSGIALIQNLSVRIITNKVLQRAELVDYTIQFW
jgi:hypothetical protein